MKNKKKRFILIFSLCLAAFCAVTAGIAIFGKDDRYGLTTGAVTVYNADGEKTAEYKKEKAGVVASDALYNSYVEYAVNEAVNIFCDKYGIKKEKAEKLIFGSDIKVITNASREAFSAAEKAYKENTSESGASSTVVISDAGGRVLSCVDYENGNDNLCSKRHNVGSAFKPLGVYAPGIEKGVLNWSTAIPDQPVKSVTDKNGKARDWPENYGGKYSMMSVNLCDGVARSLNTVAVRSLQELSVNSALDFLDTLGIDTAFEREAVLQNGEDEVLGSIALGYLKSKFSAVDMAGYYQIFANGGKYTAPYFISEIYCGKEKIYTASKKAKRIISEETAFIMNRLLQGVVSDGATGAAAQIDGLKIGGKTGTTDGYLDNWFVGFTPRYVCAVWYGFGEEQPSRTENRAVLMFKTAVRNMNNDTSLEYPQCDGVEERSFCVYSGLPAADGCRVTKTGYYKKADTLPKCTLH